MCGIGDAPCSPHMQRLRKHIDGCDLGNGHDRRCARHRRRHFDGALSRTLTTRRFRHRRLPTMVMVRCRSMMLGGVASMLMRMVPIPFVMGS